jgi:hypothetical protein
MMTFTLLLFNINLLGIRYTTSN